jgi:GMP reductase
VTNHLEYSDILLRHGKSVVGSRSECDTSAVLGKYAFAVPVIAANMKSILNRDICKQFDEANWFYVYPRIDGADDVYNFAQQAINKFRVISISVGVKSEWVRLVKSLAHNGIPVDYFTVDVALSYNDNVLPVLRMIREHYPESYVILGNGCTKEWVEWVKNLEQVNGLDLVDCIKVGIGVSQACRTRQYTGFGSSTLGSLKECYEESMGNPGLDVISDGGLTIQDGVVCIGDIAKALVFGADFVMSGALFARCIDSPALRNGYFGNASREAKGNNHVEGELIKVESNGLTIKEMMKLVRDSLRSSISYSGGRDLVDLSNADFDIINSSLAHD